MRYFSYQDTRWPDFFGGHGDRMGLHKVAGYQRGTSPQAEIPAFNVPSLLDEPLYNPTRTYWGCHSAAQDLLQATMADVPVRNWHMGFGWVHPSFVRSGPLRMGGRMKIRA